MSFVVTLTVFVTRARLAPTVPVVWYVLVVVPVVSNKVDRPTAGVVLRAVLAPVFLVTRWYVQIDRRSGNELRCPLNHHRFRVDQLWAWGVTNIDLPIETGLADAD
jgi:hypothetical protein